MSVTDNLSVRTTGHGYEPDDPIEVTIEGMISIVLRCGNQVTRNEIDQHFADVLPSGIAVTDWSMTLISTRANIVGLVVIPTEYDTSGYEPNDNHEPHE